MGKRLTIALVLVLLLPLTTFAGVREGNTSVRITVTDQVGMRVLPPEDAVRLRVIEHEERPSHNSAPACAVTTDDTQSTYGDTGWHLPPGDLPYLVNTGRAPRDIRGQVREAIAQAAGTWRNADAAIGLQDGGTTSVKRARYDGKNVMTWDSLRRGVVAVAYIWYDPATGTIIDSDMIFSTRVRWSVNDPSGGDCAGVPATYDVQAVATHELGHWIGLDDLTDEANADLTMYGIVTHRELKKSSLGAGDIAGAQAVTP